jgi:hypothetical protein
VAEPTWTGSADFGGTITASGTGWSIDSLTIPSGNAPGSAPVLAVAIAFTSNPGTSYLIGAVPVTSFATVDVFGVYFVDSGGSEHRFQPTQLQNLASAGTPSVAGRVVVFPGAVGDDPSAADINGGGHIRIRTSTSINTSATEVVTGTLVAAIFDGTNPSSVAPTAGFIRSSETTGSSESSSTSTTPSSGFDYTAIFPIMAGWASSSPASTPDFTGVAGWENEVARVNGHLHAAIGNFNGTRGFSSWAFSQSSGDTVYGIRILEVTLPPPQRALLVGILG